MMECSAHQTCATDLQDAASDECHFYGGAIEPGWRIQILVSQCYTNHGPQLEPLNDRSRDGPSIMTEHIFLINEYVLVVTSHQMDIWIKRLTLVVERGLPTLTPAGIRTKDSKDTRQVTENWLLRLCQKQISQHPCLLNLDNARQAVVSPSIAPEPLCRSRDSTAASRDDVYRESSAHRPSNSSPRFRRIGPFVCA